MILKPYQIEFEITPISKEYCESFLFPDPADTSARSKVEPILVLRFRIQDSNSINNVYCRVFRSKDSRTDFMFLHSLDINYLVSFIQGDIFNQPLTFIQDLATEILFPPDYDVLDSHIIGS